MAYSDEECGRVVPPIPTMTVRITDLQFWKSVYILKFGTSKAVDGGD
jgi:hypothetical protein